MVSVDEAEPNGTLVAETTCVEAARVVDRIRVITEGVVGVALEAAVNRDL